MIKVELFYKLRKVVNSYNRATRPYAMRTDHEIMRQAQRAKAAWNIMRKHRRYLVACDNGTYFVDCFGYGKPEYRPVYR